MTIIPSFDPTITGNPNAAQIMATINACCNVYQTTFSDPVTVKIYYMGGAPPGAIAQTTKWTITGNLYTQIYNGLKTQAKSADDMLSLTNLPAPPNNPVDGTAKMTISLPNARVLGIPGANPMPGLPAPFPAAAVLDAGIQIDLTSVYFDRTHTVHGVGPGPYYDLQSALLHEMDEVLGLGSGLPTAAAAATPPYPSPCPQDLWRYDGTGTKTRSYTGAVGAPAWLSFDGITNIVQFNQAGGLPGPSTGDYGDWVVHIPPQVQDFAGTPGASPDLGPNELRNLDVIGYTLTGGGGGGGTSPTGPTGGVGEGSFNGFVPVGSGGAAGEGAFGLVTTQSVTDPGLFVLRTRQLRRTVGNSGGGGGLGGGPAVLNGPFRPDGSVPSVTFALAPPHGSKMVVYNVSYLRGSPAGDSPSTLGSAQTALGLSVLAALALVGMGALAWKGLQRGV